MDHDVFCDDGPPISRLQTAVKALEEYVFQVVPLPSSASTAAHKLSEQHNDSDSNNSDDIADDGSSHNRDASTHAARATRYKAAPPADAGVSAGIDANDAMAPSTPTIPSDSSNSSSSISSSRKCQSSRGCSNTVSTVAATSATASPSVSSTASASTATTAPLSATLTSTPATMLDRRRTARKLLATPSSSSPVHVFSRQDLARSNWRELARAHVVIVGLGAVGAVAAEALVRAGVGKLLLVDHDCVHMHAMGAMGYYPHDAGFSRVQALQLRLQSIASDTASTTTTTSVESFSADLSSDADVAKLKKRLKTSSVGIGSSSTASSSSNRTHGPHATASSVDTDTAGGTSMGLFEALTLKRPYDAVLCCTDDESSKLRLNDVCLQLSLPLLDVDVPPSNVTIGLRAVLPGHTCCLACIRQQDSANHALTPMDQVARSIARAFPACLPHVDATAGGLIAQMALKFLLELGEFVPFFTLDMLTFEVASYSFPPSRSCPSAACVERQEEERTAAY